jgi:hypothetical protein
MAALTTFAAYLLGLLAGAVAVGAVFGLFTPPFVLSATQAAALHVGAAVLAAVAARLRLSGLPADDAERGRVLVEGDVAALTALFVPLFGPSLAWLFPRRQAASIADAHAWFEQHALVHGKGRLRAVAPQHAAPDALPHDVMSFSEVLRSGTLDHKRNALRGLAQRGTPRHLAMLRDTLYSDNVELRLCAYGEIQTLARAHEARLASLQHDLDALPADGSRQAERHLLLTEAAAAHQAYAATGLLDPEMRRYHLQRGVRYAQEAWLAEPTQARIATVYARTLSDLGDHGHALRAFAHLRPQDQQRPDVCLAQAEVAFRDRDFAAACAAGKRLAAQRLVLPDWLQALIARGGGSTVAEGSA